MDRAQGRVIARDQEAAARIPVQAVHQLEGLAGLESPQSLDDPKADAAAPMHRNAGRLVQDAETTRLLHDRPLDRLQHPRRRTGPCSRPSLAASSAVRPSWRIALPDGRYADPVMGAQARFRPGASAVN